MSRIGKSVERETIAVMWERGDGKRLLMSMRFILGVMKIPKQGSGGSCQLCNYTKNKTSKLYTLKMSVL